jgi:hypothetical protein
MDGSRMNPGTGNLDIYRGDTKRWQFKLWTDAKRTVPADLTGVTVNASIRDKALSGSYETALACTVAAPNTINMTLTASQSRDLPAVGVWDLQLTYSNGDIYTVLKGAVIVTQDVTRSNAAVQSVRRVK